MNIKDLSSEQLRRIIDIKSQIEDLESELDSIAGGSTPARRGRPGRPKGTGRAPGRPKGALGRPPGRPKGRKMSAAGRRAIAEAAKKRWAAYRGEAAAKSAKAVEPVKQKRKFSAAARAKIAAAAKARWARVKAAGKTRL